MKWPRLFLLALTSLSMARGGDWNSTVLAAVATMPEGGGYSASTAAGAKLQAAVRLDGARVQVRAAEARPSYCSGATYLVLLKAIEMAQSRGALTIDSADARAMLPAAQADGHGVWGRWNANGPGTARLFAQLGLGRNFTSFDEARPGDFLKIFWRDAVGAREFGHSVVYLGCQTMDGVEQVRFWSSNKPGGYGEKTVPRAKIARAIFSRLENPERFAQAATLPEVDRYLAGLLEHESSFAEACRLSGVR